MINVVIPMAGAGSRFEKAGFKDPKPLINVGDKPMVQMATDCAAPLYDCNFIFIIQKKHDEKYDLKNKLKQLYKGCSVIFTDGLTEGAACTVLLAKHLINNNDMLLISNCDQYVDWDKDLFFDNVKNTDGGILSIEIKENDLKWSYAKVENNLITEVAEKKKISDFATVGIYIWNKGSDFVEDAEDMIKKNIRVNNEFYVCPVYNEGIAKNRKFINFLVNEFYGTGTPEDLDYFKKIKNI